jgi:hypothetical protein
LKIRVGSGSVWSERRRGSQRRYSLGNYAGAVDGDGNGRIWRSERGNLGIWGKGVRGGKWGI